MIFSAKAIRSIFISLFFILSFGQANVHAQLSNGNDITPVLPAILNLLMPANSCPAADDNPLDDNPLPNNINIFNQADLDALTGITRIAGISIQGSQTNLDFSPLESLVEVTGNIDLRNFTGTSIDFFNCVTTAGRVLIEDSTNLTSITGFESLTTITSPSTCK